MVKRDAGCPCLVFNYLHCLKKIDFRLFDILLHSKWVFYTTNRPISIGPLDPHSSQLHIRGNDRFIRGFVLVAITDYSTPRLIQTIVKNPRNTLYYYNKYHIPPPIAFQYPMALYLSAHRL